MPGADSSEFTRFKKLTAIQCGDTQSKDPKSVNRLTQYTSPVSTCSLSKFLPSLRKNVSGGEQAAEPPLPLGTFTFKTTSSSVSFVMNCTTSQTARLTNALCNGDNTITVVPPPSGGTIIVYDIDITNNNQEVTVSGLKNLQQLGCNNNQLTSLNVTGLTNLQVLNCYANQLTSLNVAKLTNLQGLNCSNNQLEILNVTDLTNLQILYCNNNSFPDQLTINTIVGQLPDAYGKIYFCVILTQTTNPFTTPNSVPPGWTIY